MLCRSCSRLDVGALCQPTDDVLEGRPGQNGYFWHETGGVLCVSHSAHVQELQETASAGCELCSVIGTTLKSIPLATDETASGLPIVLHGVTNARVGVSLDSPEDGLVRLCDLDVSREPNTDQPVDLPLEILDKVHHDSSSTECLALASRWLHGCIENHECGENHPLDFPSVTRFLHVGDDARHPRLIEFAPHEEPKQWATLSYCWGTSRLVTLTASSLANLQEELPLSSLDATVADAVTVVRTLGIEYLWIDALCVLQDGLGQDWMLQASKMRDIYEKSTVTIVTTNTSSADQDFLGERHRQYIAVPWHLSGLLGDADSDDAYQVNLSLSWDPSGDRLKGPWTERGWTFQEGLLPRRLLFFSTTQMVWKCCEGILYERGEKSIPIRDIRDAFLEEGGRNFWDFDLFTRFQLMPWYITIPNHNIHAEKHRLWYGLVEEFSSRRLTYQSDRLVAISGLAAKYQTILGADRYLAGLWETDLIRGLLWRVAGDKIFDEPALRHGLGDAHDCPSWSWAGLPHGHAVRNDHAAHLDCKPLSVILGVEVEYKNPSHQYGDVQKGVVKLRGPTFYFNQLYNADWRLPTAPLTAFERHVSHVVEEEYGQAAEHFTTAGQFAAVLMLQDLPSIDHRLDILILKIASTVHEAFPLARRVGVIKLVHYSYRTSSKLLSMHEGAQKSLPHRLGLSRGLRKRNIISGKAVFEELERNMWPRETISII